MLSKMLVGIFLTFIMNFYFQICGGHWVFDLRSSVEFRVKDVRKLLRNERDFPQHQFKDSLSSPIENETLFWTVTDQNKTEAAITSETESETPVNLENLSDDMEAAENEREIITNDTTVASVDASEPEVDQTLQGNKINETLLYDEINTFTMNEKIVLQRNNCRLEIAVTENSDVKIEIKFGRLRNNTCGKCYITLNGRENSRLGVMISNIYLYQNVYEGEILKVIISDFGSDFVLKEYYSWTKYEPLLLTETHRVYLVLHYNVTDVSPTEQESHFNLEVFNYHKEN